MKEYNMLIAALVGIVAIVGLVVFFNNSTGAYIYNTPRDYSYPISVDRATWEAGLEFGIECAQMAEKGGEYCCNEQCASYCGKYKGEIAGRCMDDCMPACSRGSRQAILK